ncbi:TonB-dependent receptor [Mariniphaga anaerophila]|nr:TonB-dependent receptor [Mariniphaga anaerophila]
MKLTFLFFFIGLMHLYASVYSQTTTLSLEMRNARVAEVLDAIENQSEFRFAYSSGFVDLNREVTVDIHNKTIDESLKLIFAGTGVEYGIFDRHIILYLEGMDASGNHRKGMSMTDQQQAVSGQVTDTNGQPLPGVTVVVKGTTQGTVTNADGNYSFAGVSSDATLQFSFVGMRTEEVEVGTQSLINIVLEDESIGIEEVVAVGYGTMKKNDLTGSVSQVSGEDLKNVGVRSAADALQGRSAGVMVTSTSGSPGSMGAVRIRGVGTVNNNDPLFVVDGLPQSGIGWLNPNDIESIEILKDASATSIYGARAANGVIMVTTKSGKTGEQYSSSVSFDMYVGFQNPEKRYNMLNAEQFMEFKNRAYTATGQALLDDFSTAEKREQILQFLEKNTGSREGTDWWNEIMNKNAPMQSYNVAVSGGLKKMNYHSSLGYMGQDGIVKNSDYERISWRNTLNSELTDWFKLSANVGIIYEDRRNIDEANPYSGTIFSAMTADPITPVYRDNLVDVPSFLAAKLMSGYEPSNPFSKYAGILYSNKPNPVAQVNLMGQSIWEGIAIKSGLKSEVSLFPWLKFRTNFGLDLSRGISKGFTPSYYLNGYQNSTDARVSRTYYNTNYWVWDNTLTFEKTFDLHHVLAMVGTSAEQNKYEQTGASKDGTINNNEDQRILNAATKNPAASGYDVTSSINSYFGRFFYTYHDRYLLTVNVRRDGSSNFAEGNRWGVFPSFSVGWIFSEEEFAKKYDFLSLGKLRLGAGEIGNHNIGSGAYLSTFGNSGYYVFGNPRMPFLSGGRTGVGNPNIQWETTKQINIGLDVGLFNNKITFTTDYFKKTTEDMLVQVPLPTSFGYPNTPWTNAGSVENKGFEFEVSYKERIREFRFSVDANLFTFKNKVISLGGGEPINGSTHLGNMTHTRTEVGMPIGYFYGWKTDGIFQSQSEIDAYVGADGALIQPTALPGDLKFLDINGVDEDGNVVEGPDGVLNDADRTMVGNPFPDFTWGLTLGAEYKGFDLSIFFQGSVGNDILNIIKYDIRSGAGWYNAPDDMLDIAWNGAGTSNTQFAISANSRQNLQMSDWYVEDGTYVRLKNVQLGYTIPKQLLKNLNNSIRVWVGGQNLLTITNYTGLDPEIGSSDPKFMGIDQGFYPQSRIFMMGVNATF